MDSYFEYSGAPSNVPVASYNPSYAQAVPTLAEILQQLGGNQNQTVDQGSDTGSDAQALSSLGSGATTYGAYGIADMLTQLLNMKMSDSQFWAQLGFSQAEADRQAAQWQSEFDWNKASDMAQLFYNQQLATGYMQTSPILSENGFTPDGQGTTAAQTIWNNRPDLKSFYDNAWGAGKYSITDAVNNWLSMTTDQAVLDSGRSAADYAQSQGWYTPSTTSGTSGLQKTVERENMEGTLGLGYLNLLSQLRGPADWVNYSNAVRMAQGTSLPQWAQSLYDTTGLPAFGAMDWNALRANAAMPGVAEANAATANAAAAQGGGSGYSTGNAQVLPTTGATGTLAPGNKMVSYRQWMIGNGGDPNAYYPEIMVAVDQNGQIVQPIGQGNGGATLDATSPTGNQSTGTVNTDYPIGMTMTLPAGGHKINYQQWANMLPSEQAMLQGAVEAQGGYWDDFLAQMQRAWPQRQLNPVTSYA